MRIVHVTPFYHPVIGGAENVVKQICEYLVRQGFDVYAITYNRLRNGGIGKLPPEEEINGVKVVRLRPKLVHSHGSLSPELPKVIEKLQPDIVHVHVWRHPHVFQVAKLKRRLNFRAILHLHDPFYSIRQVGVATHLYYLVVDLSLRRVLHRYDAVVTLTPLGKHVARKKFRVPQNRVVTIPPTLEDYVFYKALHLKPRPRPPGKEDVTYIVSVGRVSREKKFEMLVKTMALLRERRRCGIKTYIVGLINDFAPVKLAQRLGLLNKQVIFMGKVSEEAKLSLYSRGHIYVHTSPYEGFGIALIEAQAFALPCVITGLGGQLFAAPPGVSSLRVSLDPEGIARAIVKLIDNTRLWNLLSSGARRVASRYLASRILPRYKKLYEQILHR